MLLSSVWPTEPRADVTWGPLDERWYTPDLGLPGDSGFAIGADTLFRCGTVLAAVRFLADAYAMCPPQVVRHVGDNERKPDPTHYLQRVLRNPNLWQTGVRWRHVNMTWVATWGNAYNRIVGSPRSFAEELRPMHPSQCRLIDQRPDGSLVYEFTPHRGPKEILSQDQVLHFRGISLDGMRGAPIYQLIRNAVGIALAAEKHMATFLRKGSRLAGILIPTAPTKPDQRKLLRESWNETFGGPENTGTVATLPYGVEFKAVATDNQKSQFLEMTDGQVGAVLRALGVPGVVVGYMGDKTATYASADAFFEKGGIKHCVMPWVVNFEAEEEKALLLDGDDRQVKHNLDVLLRANTKDRYDSLFKATGRPFMTGNEARRIEDMNPDPDPSMDKVLLPGNMGTKEPDPEPAPDPKQPAPGRPAPGRKPKPPPPDEDEEAASSTQFVIDAAARVIRRELTHIRGGAGRMGGAIRFAGDPAGWDGWVRKFYEGHAAHVVDVMHVGADVAAAYVARQRDELLAGGAAVTDSWEADRVPALAALALGEE